MLQLFLDIHSISPPIPIYIYLYKYTYTHIQIYIQYTYIFMNYYEMNSTQPFYPILIPNTSYVKKNSLCSQGGPGGPKTVIKK